MSDEATTMTLVLMCIRIPLLLLQNADYLTPSLEVCLVNFGWGPRSRLLTSNRPTCDVNQIAKHIEKD